MQSFIKIRLWVSWIYIQHKEIFCKSRQKTFQKRTWSGLIKSTDFSTYWRCQAQYLLVGPEYCDDSHKFHVKEDKYVFFFMNFKTLQNLTKNLSKWEIQNTADWLSLLPACRLPLSVTCLSADAVSDATPQQCLLWTHISCLGNGKRFKRFINVFIIC